MYSNCRPVTLPGNLCRVKVLRGDSDRPIQTVSSSSERFWVTGPDVLLAAGLSLRDQRIRRHRQCTSRHHHLSALLGKGGRKIDEVTVLVQAGTQTMTTLVPSGS